MTTESLMTPTVFRTAVPQKPVTQAMLDEPHGLHNFAEYREVMDAVKNAPENQYFWARYGLTRYLGRRCRHLGTSLRVNCSSIAEDEFDQWLCFLRMTAPMLRELEQFLPSMEDCVLRVQDYSSLNRLLSQKQESENNVQYWARFGIFEGIDSWRHMSTMVLDGKMPLLELKGITHEPEAFIRHADLLIAEHRSS